MADLKERQTTPDADSNDPGQQYADREFNSLVNPEHYSKDATPGELSNGEQNSLFNPNGDNDAASAKDVAAREKVGRAGGGSAVGTATQAAGLLTGSAASTAVGLLRGRLRPTKRKGALGGIAGLLIGGGILFLSAASGPLELIHYAQILAKPFTHQSNASTSRMDKIIRWGSERDVGETRLTRVGSLVTKNTESALAKDGIELKTDRLTGQLRAGTFDTAVNHKYDGLSDSEKIAAFAKDNGIALNKVQKISGANAGGIKLGFNLSDMNYSEKTAVVGGLVNDHNWGIIPSFARIRFLKAKLGLYNSFLHPLKSFATSKDQKIADAVRAKAAKASEDSRLKALVERSPETKAKIAAVKDKLSTTTKVTGGVLLVAGAVCIAKDIAHGVPEINRVTTVVPAMKSAVDGAAVGAEVVYETAFGGQNFDMAGLGAESANRTAPDGSTPFGSQGIQDIANDTSTAKGVPLDPSIANAFTPNSSAETIDQDLKDIGADALCSKAGQFIQIVGGTALLFTGVGGVVDAGLKLGTAAAAGVAIGLLTSEVTKLLADKPLTGTPHQGTLGGNVDAYGDVALRNMNAQAQGGTELSPTESAQLDASQSAIDKQQFQSESFANRMFDTHDYRSLVSRIIDSHSSNATQNVATTLGSLFTGFTHVSSVFSNLASTLMPHVQAAPSTPYGFGMPEIGFSQADLTNPLFDDPYSNAEEAAKLFDAGAGDGSRTYIEKAAACFGVNIAKDDTGDWGVTAIQQEGGADPNSADYENANCNDNSTEWKRVRFFVLDTGTIEGFACAVLNDSESCTDSGFSETAQAPNSSTTPTTPGTYKNPLRDIKNLVPERIDGGVDYNGDDGPVYSVGDGKVIGVRSGAGSGWPGTPGAYILYQLTDGPASGKYVYMAEDCTPTVKAGDTLTPDTIICSYHYVKTAMEMGWGNGSYDYVTNDYRSHGGGSYASNSGQDFSKFLTSLPSPAPPGKVEGSKSTQPMPAGWPTW